MVGPPLGLAELELATGLKDLQNLALTGCVVKDDDLALLARFGKLAEVTLAREMTTGS